MTNWKQVLPHLERFGEITCFDIQEITNTTCPHDVIRDLRNKGYLGGYEKKKNSNGKYYRVHFIKELTLGV